MCLNKITIYWVYSYMIFLNKYMSLYSKQVRNVLPGSKQTIIQLCNCKRWPWDPNAIRNVDMVHLIMIFGGGFYAHLFCTDWSRQNHKKMRVKMISDSYIFVYVCVIEFIVFLVTTHFDCLSIKPPNFDLYVPLNNCS